MIELVRDGEVAIVRLAQRPMNTLDVELCHAVATQFGALESDPARSVVVTGLGSAFSAGADLRRCLREGESYTRRFVPALDVLFRSVFELGKPVVAAINGHAIAGGCVLAACADVRLMADGGGRIGLPELRVGVPFPRAAVEVMRYAVGDVVARRLMVGAQLYSPLEAQALGLVDEVLPADDLLPAAVDRARALAASVPSDTFAATKAQLRRDAVERMAAYADEAESVTTLWIRRIEDGWTRGYLDAVTRKRSVSSVGR